jgi:hypothetical protein
VVLRRVGLYRKRVLKPLVGLQARNTDHAVIYLSNPAQILFSYISRCLAVLAVCTLIYNQGCACGALWESSSINSTRRRLICSGSQLDSVRNHCRDCASLWWAPTTGSVLWPER